MTSRERAFWSVVEPMIGIGVGLLLCGLSARHHARRAWLNFVG